MAISQMLALRFCGSGIIYKPTQFVGLSRSVVSAQQIIKTRVCRGSELMLKGLRILLFNEKNKLQMLTHKFDSTYLGQGWYTLQQNRYHLGVEKHVSRSTCKASEVSLVWLALSTSFFHRSSLQVFSQEQGSCWLFNTHSQSKHSSCRQQACN